MPGRRFRSPNAVPVVVAVACLLTLAPTLAVPDAGARQSVPDGASGWFSGDGPVGLSVLAKRPQVHLRLGLAELGRALAVVLGTALAAVAIDAWRRAAAADDRRRPRSSWVSCTPVAARPRPSPPSHPAPHRAPGHTAGMSPITGSIATRAHRRRHGTRTNAGLEDHA